MCLSLCLSHVLSPSLGLSIKESGYTETCEPRDRETSKRRGTQTAKPRATATCEYLAGKYNSLALANLEGILPRTGITAIAFLPWNRPGPATETSAADDARAPPYDPSTQTRHLA